MPIDGGERLVIEAELRDNVSGPAARARAATRALAEEVRRQGAASTSAAAGTRRLGSDTERLAHQVRSAEARLERMSNTAGRTLVRGLARGGAAIVAAGAVLGGFGLKATAELEQTTVALETLTGSAEEGARVLARIRDIAIKSPFEMPGIARATQGLIAMQVPGDRAANIIESLTSIAAGTGRGEEGLTGMSLALGQIQTKGRAMGEELLQLAERGFPAYQVVADILGVTSEQVRKMGPRAIVSSDQFLTAVENMSGPLARFEGLAAKQGKTLTGMWATFKDEARFALIDAMKPMAAGLAEDLPRMTTGVRGALMTITPPLVRLATTVLKTLLEAAPRIAPVLGEMAGGFEKLAPHLPAVVDILASLAGLLPTVTTALGLVAPVLGPLSRLLDLLLGFGPTRAILGALLVGLLAFSTAAKVARGVDAIRLSYQSLVGTLRGVPAAQAAANRALATAPGAAGKGGATLAAGGAAAKGGRLAAAGGIMGILSGLLAAVTGAGLVGDAASDKKAGPGTILKGAAGGALIGGALGSVIPFFGTAAGAIAGGAIGATGAVLTSILRGRKSGDTASPRRGLLGAAEGLAPGSRTVTSGLRGWGLGSPGSDHAAGRAQDLTGPWLNAYADTVRQMGGWAEFHGSGPSRHLHAVGDTASPHAFPAGGGGGGLVVNGPLVSVGRIDSALDVEAMARRVSRAVMDERAREDRERHQRSTAGAR